MKIDERLLAYKPISVTLNFDWDKMTYDERVLARHNYIEEQKKKDPNYIGWDFAELVMSEYGPGSNLSSLTILRSVTSIISTIGQIARINSKTNCLELTLGISDNGYKHVHVTFVDKVYKKCRIHRLVGSTFIPIPDHLKEHRSHLVINHKNDIKTCNLRSNLEWCTGLENTKKAIETGAREVGSYIATWEVDDEHKGKTFYFKDLNEIRDYIPYGNIHQSIYGKLKTQYGCSWKFIDKALLINKVTGFTREVYKLLQDPCYINPRTMPVIGTIIKPGKYCGLTFVLLGGNEIKSNGFILSNIRSVIMGRRNKHKNCSWSRCDLIESKKHQRGLTKDQKKFLG